MFEGLARWVFRHRIPVFLLALAILAGAGQSPSHWWVKAELPAVGRHDLGCSLDARRASVG